MLSDLKLFLSYILDPFTLPDSPAIRIYTSSFRNSEYVKTGRFLFNPTLTHEVIAEQIKKTVFDAHPDADHYICMGFQDARYKVKKTRLSQTDVHYIPALLCDIDVMSADHHKRQNLCPDKDVAVIFLRSLLFPPSLIIDTGGGVHGYWTFTEPMDEPERAYRLRKSFLKNYLASQFDYHLDPVFNLDRIMRLPSSVNTKTGTEVKVIHKNYRQRYNWQDIEEELKDLNMLIGEEIDLKSLSAPMPDFRLPDPPQVSYTPPSAQLSQTQEPHQALSTQQSLPSEIPESVKVALENDPDLQVTWDHQRDDFVDQSQSSYDLSLLISMLSSGISDEDAVKAIQINRIIRNNNPSKIHRTDYYIRTLKKAKDMVAQVTGQSPVLKASGGIEQESLVSNMDDEYLSSKAEEIVNSVLPHTDAPNQPQISLDDVYRFLARNGIPLRQIIRHETYEGDLKHYELIWLDGTSTVTSATPESLALQTNSYIRWAELMNRVNHPVKNQYSWAEPRFRAFDVPAAQSSPEVFMIRAMLALTIISSERIGKEGTVESALSEFLTHRCLSVVPADLSIAIRQKRLRMEAVIDVMSDYEQGVMVSLYKERGGRLPKDAGVEEYVAQMTPVLLISLTALHRFMSEIGIKGVSFHELYNHLSKTLETKSRRKVWKSVIKRARLVPSFGKFLKIVGPNNPNFTLLRLRSIELDRIGCPLDLEYHRQQIVDTIRHGSSGSKLQVIR